MEEYEADLIEPITATNADFLQQCVKRRCALLLVPSLPGGQVDESGKATVDESAEARDRRVIAEARREDADKLVKVWRAKYAKDPIAFGVAEADALRGWREAFGAETRVLLLHLKRQRFAVCTESEPKDCAVSLLDAALSGGGDWAPIPDNTQFLN